jgi:hypothetical protein
MAYFRCRECGECVSVGPELYDPRVRNAVNSILIKRFNRHCIDKRHLLGDGGISSYLVEFADFRLGALPPEATAKSGRTEVIITSAEAGGAHGQS